MKDADTALIGVIRDDLKSLSAKSARLADQRTFTILLIVFAIAVAVVFYVFDSSAWVVSGILACLAGLGWVHSYDRDKDIQRQIAETEDRLSVAGYVVRWNNKATDVEIFSRQ